MCVLFGDPGRERPRACAGVSAACVIVGVLVGQTAAAPSALALPLLLTLTSDFPLLHEANNEADPGRPCSSPSFTGGHRGDAG